MEKNGNHGAHAKERLYPCKITKGGKTPWHYKERRDVPHAKHKGREIPMILHERTVYGHAIRL